MWKRGKNSKENDFFLGGDYCHWKTLVLHVEINCVEIKSKLMRCCCFNTHRHCFIRSLSSINKTKTKQQEHLNQIRQRKQYQFKDILISFYKLIPPPPPKQQIPVVCSPIPIPKRFSVFFLRINTATIQSTKKATGSSCLFSHIHTKSLVFSLSMY